MTDGGDPEALDDDECPVLLEAVKFGNSETMRLLLNGWASALVRTADGQILLQIAAVLKKVFRQRMRYCSDYQLPRTFLPDELPELPIDALEKAWSRCSYRNKFTNLMPDSIFSQVLQKRRRPKMHHPATRRVDSTALR